MKWHIHSNLEYPYINYPDFCLIAICFFISASIIYSVGQHYLHYSVLSRGTMYLISHSGYTFSSSVWSGIGKSNMQSCTNCSYEVYFCCGTKRHSVWSHLSSDSWRFPEICPQDCSLTRYTSYQSQQTNRMKQSCCIFYKSDLSLFDCWGFYIPSSNISNMQSFPHFWVCCSREECCVFISVLHTLNPSHFPRPTHAQADWLCHIAIVANSIHYIYIILTVSYMDDRQYDIISRTENIPCGILGDICNVNLNTSNIHHSEQQPIEQASSFKFGFCFF